MFDIHEQQFLVLLLMMKPESDQIGHAAFELVLQQCRDCVIDEFPITGDLRDAGT